MEHETAESDTSGIFALSRVTIPARMGLSIEALVPNVRGHQVTPGQGCFETGQKLHQVGVHTGPGVLTEIGTDGMVSLPLMNMSDREVTIQPGTALGLILHTAKAMATEIAEMRNATGPLMRSKKKDEYIQNFVRKAKENKNKEKKVNTSNFTTGQKRKWILDTFELAKKPCLQEPSHLEAAVNLLMKYWDLFSHDGSYGHTHLIQHRILTKDIPPIKCQYCPINPVLEPALWEQLDEWLRHDVIKPADSPWSLNLVAAKKKGGKIQWCIDWRRLNQVTKKDSWPMPTVQDTIAQLAGSNIFSSVGMPGAFHCIDIHTDDTEKTAFTTPFGTFQQKHLGFGITNGPATYCRLVDRVLCHIPPLEALSFVDDRVIHSAGFQCHLINLDKTLKAYQDAGLKLGPKKCTFFSPQITYLGHIVDRHGIRPVFSYVRAVRDWPMPKYKTEARAFLGITG